MDPWLGPGSPHRDQGKISHIGAGRGPWVEIQIKEIQAESLG